MMGFVPRNSKGYYDTPLKSEMKSLSTVEDTVQSQLVALAKGDIKSVTIDPNDISPDSLSLMLRAMPRDRLFVINQDDTYYTMNDAFRNQLTSHIFAHQKVHTLSSRRWPFGLTAEPWACGR